MSSAPAAVAGPAADPQAPYVRLAVVGLIRRINQGGTGGDARAEGPGGPQWLLLHRSQPFTAWDPPGGRMEAGEDLSQAVLREVREETGLTVDVAGPCYGFLTYYEGERLLAVSMACRPVGDPDAIRLEPGGAGEWRWATRAEWEALAEAGLSSWHPMDVKKATGAAAAVWEGQEG